MNHVSPRMAVFAALATLGAALPAQTDRSQQIADRVQAPVHELTDALGADAARYDLRLVLGLEQTAIPLGSGSALGVRPLLVIDPRGMPALPSQLDALRAPVYAQAVAVAPTFAVSPPIVTSSVVRIDPPPILQTENLKPMPKNLSLDISITDSIPAYYALHARLVVPTTGHELHVMRIERTTVGTEVDLIWLKPSPDLVVMPVTETITAYAPLGTDPGPVVHVRFGETDDLKRVPEFHLVAKLRIPLGASGGSDHVPPILTSENLKPMPKNLTLAISGPDLRGIPPDYSLIARLEVPTAGHALQVVRIERTSLATEVDLLWVRPSGPVPPVSETLQVVAPLGADPGPLVYVRFGETDDPKQIPEFHLIAKLLVPISASSGSNASSPTLGNENLKPMPKNLTLQISSTDSIPPHYALHASLVVDTAGHELRVHRVQRAENATEVDLWWLKPSPDTPVPPVIETLRSFTDLGTDPGAAVYVRFGESDDPKKVPEFQLVAKLRLP